MGRFEKKKVKHGTLERETFIHLFIMLSSALLFDRSLTSRGFTPAECWLPAIPKKQKSGGNRYFFLIFVDFYFFILVLFGFSA